MPVFHISPQNDTFGSIDLNPTAEDFWIFYSNTSTCYHLCATLESNAQIVIRFEASSEINNQRSMHRQLLQCTVINDVM